MKDNVNKLEPDREQISTFVRTLFKYAYPTTWISLRSFYEDSDEVYKIWCVQVGNLDAVVEGAYRMARSCARGTHKIVFAPPVATFNNSKTARKEDVVDGVALDAEIDKAPQASRVTLEKLLGPATIVVESGGEWTNPETGEVEPKLHLHWRLKRPARGSDRELLEEARALVIDIGGSDPSHKPISHPIRWPGSWHRKGEPKLCRIIKVDDDREIDLHAALTALRKVAPNTRRRVKRRKRKQRDEPIERDLIVAALEAIPTTAALVNYWVWVQIGAALFHEFGDDGFELFDWWSSKSSHYNAAGCRRKWRECQKFTQFTGRTILFFADKASPNWRHHYEIEQWKQFSRLMMSRKAS